MRESLKKCSLLLCAVIIVYIELYAIWNYYFIDNVFAKENLISALLFIGGIYLFYKFCLIKDKRAILCGSILGSLLGIIMVLGNKLYTGNLEDIFVSFRSILKYGCLTAGEIFLWTQLSALLYNKILNSKIREYKYEKLFSKGKKTWIILWLIMFIGYMPCYFAIFPGIMSYDSGWITRQALGIIPFDNFHPYLHTLIWTGCIRLEQMTGIPQLGLIVYSIGQVLLVTALFTYIVYFMIKRNANPILIIFTYLFYMLCPNIVVFSFITTKDILFGASVALFTLLLIHLWEIKEKALPLKKFIPLVASGILSCLFRNNMIYAIMGAGMIIVFFSKVVRKQFAASFLVIAAAYFFVTGFIYSDVLGVGPGDAREMLSVPFSQIARVYTLEPEKLTEQEKQLILMYNPTAGDYNELFADPVKDSFNTEEFLNNKKEFLGLWGELFKKAPLTYLEAFLTLNVPYWYPEADGIRTYIEMGNYSSYYTFESTNWLPQISNFYGKVAANTSHENISGVMRWPLFRQLFSLSLPFWLMVVMIISLAARKEKNWILPFMPLIFLWLTYMLGPVSNFRYIYPFTILYPVFVWYILGGGTSHNKKEIIERQNQ